jgi:hypothetical protein
MKASQLRELIRELIQNHMDEMSTTGALVQPGGQQIATTKAFTSMRDWKKINKNRKWEESVNESFTIDPDKQLANIKDAWDDGLHTGRTTSTPSDAKRKWEEFQSRTNINESITESYRRFKKKVTNPRQQMNNSVREIEKHLREVDKIVEYNLKLKTEMDVGGGTFYEGTNKRLARISERMNKLNNKLKELGN